MQIQSFAVKIATGLPTHPSRVFIDEREVRLREWGLIM